MLAPSLKAVPAIEPSRSALRRQAWALRAIGWAGRLVLRRWLDRVEIIGREHLHGGPRLILLNHSHVLDPFLLSLYAGRPLQFMITEPAMFDRPLARLIARTGQVPKRKLESDTRSIRLLKKWCDVGGAAVVFPEGRFPWDGRLLPLQPGLVHLVHYLDVPVVTVRQINGDRFWPPWATHPRKTTVRLEVDPPTRFEPGAPIEDLVADRLRVDPDRCARYPTRGTDLAAGLARLLAACPSCGGYGDLEERGDELRCGSCRGSWQVGTDNHLRGAGESFDVGEALRRVRARLEERWLAGLRHRSLGAVRVFDASGDTWVPLASGRLELEGALLRAGDWRLDLGEVIAHTLDWGDLILLRTRRQRLALSLPVDSRALWTTAIDCARAPHMERDAPLRAAEG